MMTVSDTANHSQADNMQNLYWLESIPNVEDITI